MNLWVYNVFGSSSYFIAEKKMGGRESENISTWHLKIIINDLKKKKAL